MPQAQSPAAASTNAPPVSVNLPSTSSNVSATPDDGQSSNIYKNMSLQELMDQEVTSVSKTPEPYGQAPAAIQVITNDEIRRSGASSLPEALRLADNLEVAQDNAHDWNISARGFNADLSNKLLVLIDGRTVYSPLFSGVIWDAQNVMLEDLDRIEVISGPGGTLWGENAVNGVINIITKSAQETQGWYVEGGGGSELRDFGAIRYGGTLAPNVYYRVYGTYFDRNNEVYPGGTPATDAWSQGQGGFRIDTAGTSDDKFTLESEYYNGAAGSTPVTGTDVQSGDHVLGRWTHTFSSDSAMSLQLYYDRTNFSEPTAALVIKGVMFEPAGIFSDSLDTYDLDFQHNFNLGDRNKITWGAGYRFTHDQNDNSPTLAFYPAPLNQNLLSTFVQDEIKLQDDLFFTLGTKVEHNDYTGFEVQPSGRLQWNITPKQMIWTAVSRAVRTPSRVDHDLVEPTGLPPSLPQSLLTGTTAFTSETLIAYELGYRAQLGDNISGSLSTFYNDYTKIRSTTPSAPFGFPIYFQNNLEGETYGFELSTDYQMLDWWRWHAGYDFLKEHIHVTPGQVDFTNGLNETADPQNQVFLRSSMDLPQNMEFDTGGRFIDSLTINNGPTPATVPGYFELDARLAWHPTKNLEISVVGQNLLHDQHAEYGFPGPTQVQIERSVYGKITWHF
jgi:iron complex outermembrane receptor protein